MIRSKNMPPVITFQRRREAKDENLDPVDCLQLKDKVKLLLEIPEIKEYPKIKPNPRITESAREVRKNISSSEFGAEKIGVVRDRRTNKENARKK